MKKILFVIFLLGLFFSNSFANSPKEKVSKECYEVAIHFATACDTFSSINNFNEQIEVFEQQLFIIQNLDKVCRKDNFMDSVVEKTTYKNMIDFLLKPKVQELLQKINTKY